MENAVLIKDSFTRAATLLRKEFNQRFKPSEQPPSERFVWDWWHVPDQYTLLRTPAYHYFSQDIYMKLHHQLVAWGRKNLGCWDITPPWLSCYIDGCKQELHSDVPHGPWAFVFSLSPQRPLYRGGETLLLRSETLNYWQNFTRTQDRELSSFVDRIPAKFNRLVVFDPRIPHGVTEVSGTKDPREGRLVVHGWFTTPKTYIEGGLALDRKKYRRVEGALNEAFGAVAEYVQTEEPCQGVISLRLKVARSGEITSARFLTNSLVMINGGEPSHLNREILRAYRHLSFDRTASPSEITVPLLFS